MDNLFSGFDDTEKGFIGSAGDGIAVMGGMNDKTHMHEPNPKAPKIPHNAAKRSEFACSQEN